MPELEVVLERLVGVIVLVMLVTLALLATVSIVWTLASDDHEQDRLG
ncbi:hypothetical protein ACNOYE_05775 [Nannocystaceae bacterium ST9]